MSIQQIIKKTAVIALLALSIQVAYAAFSFTGIADEKTKASKYSLKNLSSLSHKGLSFSSLRSSLTYRGNQGFTKETPQGTEISSMLRYDNGNTSFIYPYKFKVKAPKFKTPAPTVH
ncbi:MAG: hypothetical protein RLZZ28_2456 [Bacteroidota bacterium]